MTKKNTKKQEKKNCGFIRNECGSSELLKKHLTYDNEIIGQNLRLKRNPTARHIKARNARQSLITYFLIDRINMIETFSPMLNDIIGYFFPLHLRTFPCNIWHPLHNFFSCVCNGLTHRDTAAW